MKLLFIGAININNKPIGGEDYKNQIFLKELQRKYDYIDYVDTFFWKKRPLILIHLVNSVFFKRYDSIIISASSFSVYRLLKTIYLVNPSKLKNIIYFVIGGYLPTAIVEGKFKKKYYENLKTIVVEGQILKDELLILNGTVNIVVIPNFKSFNKGIVYNRKRSETFKFVFLGRISEPKGVFLILKAAERIIQNFPNYEFIVDFYGSLEIEFNNTNRCSYKGILNFIDDGDKSYSELANYNCLLFPTNWIGEGFPGVIIDAYIAGLPVIATDWRLNSQLINSGTNGFLIRPENVEDLVTTMLFIMKASKEELKQISENNLKLSNNYHSDSVFPTIYELIQN